MFCGGWLRWGDGLPKVVVARVVGGGGRVIGQKNMFAVHNVGEISILLSTIH